MMNRLRTLSVFVGLSLILSASAYSALPPCKDRKQQISVNNDDVIQWKTSTGNQFKSRAHVRGVLAAIYPDRNDHAHFQIELDTTDGTHETLEVVYSYDFGKLPQLETGMVIESCGDYITSSVDTDRYPASPDGAIIHWIHRSNNERYHESGYLAIDGVVYE